MKIIPLKQRDESACGPTCIQMVSNYFKMPHTYEDIAKISQYQKRDGLSNTDLVETIRQLNLQIKTKSNAKWTDLIQNMTINKAIIVSWMKFGYIGHFSVVTQVGKNFIKIADPQEGKIIKMEKIMFMRLWMDYDDMWYPLKNSDIQLRWMGVVSGKQVKKT